MSQVVMFAYGQHLSFQKALWMVSIHNLNSQYMYQLLQWLTSPLDY
jgi:hypothetical protein